MVLENYFEFVLTVAISLAAKLRVQLRTVLDLYFEYCVKYG